MTITNNWNLMQQDGWKTQDGRMMKKCCPRLCIPATFFRHSAVLSLPAVLLRKVRNNIPRIPNLDNFLSSSFWGANYINLSYNWTWGSTRQSRSNVSAIFIRCYIFRVYQNVVPFLNQQGVRFVGRVMMRQMGNDTWHKFGKWRWKKEIENGNIFFRSKPVNWATKKYTSR